MMTWLARLRRTADPAPRLDDRDGRNLCEVDLDGAVELELIEQRVG